jgi:hypothetical protein
MNSETKNIEFGKMEVVVGNNDKSGFSGWERVGGKKVSISA